MVELLISLFISTLLISGVIAFYLEAESVNQEQNALITLFENSHSLFYFLRTEFDDVHPLKIEPYHSAEMKKGTMGVTVDHIEENEIRSYFVGDTKRKNDRGDIIYALFCIDEKGHKTELVEGVNDMKIQYSVLHDNNIIEIVESEITNHSIIKGIEIEWTLVSIHSPYLQKKEYSYEAV